MDDLSTRMVLFTISDSLAKRTVWKQTAPNKTKKHYIWNWLSWCEYTLSVFPITLLELKVLKKIIFLIQTDLWSCCEWKQNGWFTNLNSVSCKQDLINIRAKSNPLHILEKSTESIFTNLKSTLFYYFSLYFQGFQHHGNPKHTLPLKKCGVSKIVWQEITILFCKDALNSSSYKIFLFQIEGCSVELSIKNWFSQTY